MRTIRSAVTPPPECARYESLSRRISNNHLRYGVRAIRGPNLRAAPPPHKSELPLHEGAVRADRIDSEPVRPLVGATFQRVGTPNRSVIAVVKTDLRESGIWGLGSGVVGASDMRRRAASRSCGTSSWRRYLISLIDIWGYPVDGWRLADNGVEDWVLGSF